MTELPASIALDDAVITVDHPAASGSLHLDGGNVSSWRPGGGEDRLWLSPLSEVGPGSPLRGGVPICFPWFAFDTGDRQPQHGFARRARWQLTGAEEGDDGVTVRLRLSDADVADTPGRGEWPHPFAAELTARLGVELSVELTVINTGDQPFRYSGALHTYLSANAARVGISGLDGVGYFDKVLQRRDVQAGVLPITTEIDRILDTVEPLRLDDGTRALDVVQNGGTHTVVWNPWIDRSAMLTDLPDDAYRQFVCIEAAVIPGSEPTIEPGARHTLAQRLIPTD